MKATLLYQSDVLSSQVAKTKTKGDIKRVEDVTLKEFKIIQRYHSSFYQHNLQLSLLVL